MGTERFDKEAAGWDGKPQRVQLAHAIAEAIIATLPLTGSMVGLEYGCGTGLVALEVAPHVHTVYGLDTSTGMITVLEEKLRDNGVTNVVPFHGELTDLQVSSFDFMYISMVLHHIDNYEELLTRFAHHLKDGGFLAVADLQLEDGTFHDDNTGIAHFGFDRDLLREQAAQCGFSAITDQTIYTLEKNERAYPVFLLTARKG